MSSPHYLSFQLLNGIPMSFKSSYASSSVLRWYRYDHQSSDLVDLVIVDSETLTVPQTDTIVAVRRRTFRKRKSRIAGLMSRSRNSYIRHHAGLFAPDGHFTKFKCRYGLFRMGDHGFLPRDGLQVPCAASSALGSCTASPTPILRTTLSNLGTSMTFL